MAKKKKSSDKKEDKNDKSKEEALKREDFLKKLEEKRRNPFQNPKNLKGNISGGNRGSQIKPNPGAMNKTQHKG